MNTKNIEKNQKNVLIWLIFLLYFVILFIIISSIAYFSSQNISEGTIRLTELDFSIYESGDDISLVIPAQTIDKSVTLINSRNISGTDTQNLCPIYFKYWIDLYIDDEYVDSSSLIEPIFSNQNTFTNDNGVYYCNLELFPQNSVNLCNSIHFSNMIGNEFQNKEITIVFNINAIQSGNNAYLELWPDAPNEWIKNIQN